MSEVQSNLTKKRRSAVSIMGSLIGLVKPLLHIMIAAIILGTAGYLCAIFLTILAGQVIVQEVEQDGQRFRRKPVFNFMIRWLCPIFAAIILASSVANAFGWIAM